MSESDDNSDDQSYEVNDHRKRQKSDKADRISALPDALIIHILSFLHMKQVVQTGVLSKRWHLLRTSAHTLIFRHSGFQERDINKFLTFVDDTLLVSQPSKVKKFSVEFSYGKHFVRRVNRWMIFIKNKYVEEIDLYLKQRGLSDNYSLPQLMYSNMWLQELKLCNCNLVPKGEINWPALRVLEIKDAELSQDIIKKICSGCPALESLKFNDCSGVWLNIDSKSLKKLVIDGSWYDDDDDDNEEEELKIYARNVTSLEISGYFHNKRPVLGNVQTLVDAKLDFCRKTDDYEDDENDFTSDQNMLKELLVSLQHVEKLSIGYWCLQVLTILEMRNLSCPMMRCKYLTLNTRMKKWVLPGIAVLLQSCPQVEILNINMEAPCEDEYFYGSYFKKSNDFNEENYWISRPCWVLHLKTLRIDGFWTFVDYSDENILSFLQVVLKNALVLEKISIDSLEDDMWIFHGDYKKVAEKLLSFPRSSKDAVILFSG